MNLLARGTRWLFVLLSLLVVAYGGLCLWVYRTGLRSLPEDLPPSDYRAPQRIHAQYLAIEAPRARSLPRLDPFTLMPYWYWRIHRRGPMHRDDDLRILGAAARHTVVLHGHAHETGDYHAAEIAAAIIISRRWNLDEAVDTLLAEVTFDDGVHGIEAGARHYFGVVAADLNAQESLALIVLMRGPRWYDFYCHRERFDARYVDTARKLGKTGPEWAPATALARLRPAQCARR